MKLTPFLAAVLFVTLAGLCPDPAYAQQDNGSWLEKTAGPESVYSGGCATDGTSVYVWNDFRKLRRYDPATDTWDTTLADLPYQVAYVCSAYQNGYLYSFGSVPYPPLPPGAGTSTPANPILKYGIASNTWTTLPITLSAHGYYTSAARLGSKIYITGGYPSTGYTNAVSEFDPATETLTPMTPMPISVSRHASCASSVTGKLYVFGGGYYSSATGAIVYASTYEFDPATNTWTQKADMNVNGTPAVRIYHRAVEINGRIYVCGGREYNASQTPVSWSVDTCLEYDPATDTWTQRANMPKTRHGHCWTAVSGKGYAYGGASSSGDTTINTSMEEFTAPYFAPPPPPPAPPPANTDDGGSHKRSLCGGSVTGDGASSCLLVALLVAAALAVARALGRVQW